jgi:hypothetical protein
MLKTGGSYLFSVWDDLDTNEFAHVISDAAVATFPNAIMRRIIPLPRREQWARQVSTESLTPIPELENSLG